MARITKARLVKAAKEINKVLSLTPPIPNSDETTDLKPEDVTVSKLTADITDVVEDVVQEDDEFSKATMATIADLGLDFPGAEEEEVEEAEEKKEEPPAKETKKAPKPKKTSMSRISAMIEVLKKNKKPFTQDEIAEKSSALYIEHGGTDKIAEAKWFAKVGIEIGLALGSIEEKKEGSFLIVR